MSQQARYGSVVCTYLVPQAWRRLNGLVAYGIWLFFRVIAILSFDFRFMSLFLFGLALPRPCTVRRLTLCQQRSSLYYALDVRDY